MAQTVLFSCNRKHEVDKRPTYPTTDGTFFVFFCFQGFLLRSCTQHNVNGMENLANLNLNHPLDWNWEIETVRQTMVPLPGNLVSLRWKSRILHKLRNWEAG